MDTVTLTPEILDWVASRLGTSREEIPAAIAKREPAQRRIASGEVTISQVAKLANLARVPFGTLFLVRPPAAPQVDIPDLRQIPMAEPLGEDFVDVYTDALARQAWYRRQLISRGVRPLAFVGRYKWAQRPTPQVVASDIAATLQLSDRDRAQCPNSEAYFSLIAQRAEAAGVLVMKAGYVKASTRRSISPKEFRGFAVADELAPLIFVNGRDAEVATVFTLMHELAHIWLGQSGVSDIALGTARGLEKFCNQVAANLLVPAKALAEYWHKLKDVYAVGKHFRVSRYVAGIELLELGLISQAELDDAISRKLPTPRPGRPSPLAVIHSRNSRRLTREIVASAARGETLYREAASLLNVKPDTVVSLYETLRAKPAAKK